MQQIVIVTAVQTATVHRIVRLIVIARLIVYVVIVIAIYQKILMFVGVYLMIVLVNFVRVGKIIL